MEEQKKEKIILAFKLILSMVIFWVIWSAWNFLVSPVEKLVFVLWLILNIVAMAGMILKRQWGNSLYLISILICVVVVVYIMMIFNAVSSIL